MRYLLALFITLVFGTPSFSQDDVLFKIITLSFGVNVDGGAVAVGDEITGKSKMISIPKNGYLGIVTADGYLYELRSSMAVAEVNPFIKSKQLIPTGAKNRPYPMPLDIPLGMAPPRAFLLGDSLFITWEEDQEKDRLVGINYSIKFRNRDDEVLSEQEIDHNWLLANMNQLLTDNEYVLLDIQSKKTRSSGYVVVRRFKDDDQKIRDDIGRLGEHPDPAMLCAALDLNNFSHDRNFVLYKMISQRHQTPGLLGIYVARLAAQVDLK